MEVRWRGTCGTDERGSIPSSGYGSRGSLLDILYCEKTW